MGSVFSVLCYIYGAIAWGVAWLGVLIFPTSPPSSMVQGVCMILSVLLFILGTAIDINNKLDKIIDVR